MLKKCSFFFFDCCKIFTIKSYNLNHVKHTAQWRLIHSYHCATNTTTRLQNFRYSKGREKHPAAETPGSVLFLPCKQGGEQCLVVFKVFLLLYLLMYEPALWADASPGFVIVLGKVTFFFSGPSGSVCSCCCRLNNSLPATFHHFLIQIMVSFIILKKHQDRLTFTPAPPPEMLSFPSMPDKRRSLTLLQNLLITYSH